MMPKARSNEDQLKCPNNACLRGPQVWDQHDHLGVVPGHGTSWDQWDQIITFPQVKIFSAGPRGWDQYLSGSPRSPVPPL